MNINIAVLEHLSSFWTVFVFETQPFVNQLETQDRYEPKKHQSDEPPMRKRWKRKCGAGLQDPPTDIVMFFDNNCR